MLIRTGLYLSDQESRIPGKVGANAVFVLLNGAGTSTPLFRRKFTEKD